jgi:type IV pilus assembly protein PilB
VALVRLLAKSGVLDETRAEELRKALERAPNAVDAILDHVDERALAEVLSAQLGLPLVSVTRESLQPDAIRLVPREVARRYDAVPVRLEGNALLVAFVNPLDHGAIRTIEFAARTKVRIAVATASEVREAIHFAYDFQREVAKRLVETSAGHDKVEMLQPAVGEELEHLLADGDVDRASAVRVVELILVEGLTFGASDVHIEPTQNSVNVRYRIDGVMESGVVVPKNLQAQLVGRVKVLTGLDIAERRRPQDGSMSVRYEQRRIDVRVSILPTPLGEKIVMRLLDTEARTPELEAMGFSGESLRRVKKEIHRPEGMVLITGPTGSGKTTTAHAILSEIAKSPLNIVTIENPVEYRLKGITQVEINDRQGVTFAGTLRSILRQDPDVIFVGEIRDAETAEIALRASHTGHLVISTVHTIDAASSIARLLDLGADPWMIAGALRLVLAQRLMREVCKACRVPHVLTDDERHRLGSWAGEIETTVRGRGCTRCRGRGYSGRFSVAEVLPISTALRPLLESRASETQLRAQARAEGVGSLFAEACAAVKAGRTTIEELLRVIPPDAMQEDVAHGAEETRTPAADADAAEAAPRMPAPPVAPPPLSPPAAAVAPPAPPRPAPGAASPSAIAVTGIDLTLDEPQATFNVLVVDDEPTNRAVIRHCLGKSKLPLKVILAEDGPTALALAEHEPIHLALVDLMMPGMSGIELCQRLRADARWAHIPMFMLSAVEDTPQKTSAFAAGIDDYMVKPVNAAELIARVSRALSRSYPHIAAACGAAEGGRAAGASAG